MKYVILGDPIPLMRPRFNNRVVYDIQRRIKIDYAFQIELQHKRKPMYEGPVILMIDFFIKIPKASQKTHALCNRPHIYRPDLSNLIKFVEDVCTGILYKDDCSIARIEATKKYDCTPRTEFSILQLVEENDSNTDCHNGAIEDKNKTWFKVKGNKVVAK